MQLSYTQNLEDYHLSLCFAGQAEGTYVDVGAGHPIADNVSMWFYERGWRGLVVEPQAGLAALYPRLRPRDALFQGLVGRASGDIAFHQVDRLHGFSTTVTEFADGAGKFGAGYTTHTMPALTLPDLVARYGLTTIDFLKIDVEGAEIDVIAGNDFSRVRPKVIVAEAITPGDGRPAWDDWEPILLAAGYEMTLFDTLNRFYVAKEHTDILARAPRDRAPWEAATHMYEIGRAPENARHPEHALAKDLARGVYARLPHLPASLVAEVLGTARGLSSAETAALVAEIDTEAFRLRLGRIACGYDGGQIWPEA